MTAVLDLLVVLFFFISCSFSLHFTYSLCSYRGVVVHIYIYAAMLSGINVYYTYFFFLVVFFLIIRDISLVGRLVV